MNCAVLMARTIGRASSVEAPSIVVWPAEVPGAKMALELTGAALPIKM